MVLLPRSAFQAGLPTLTALFSIDLVDQPRIELGGLRKPVSIAYTLPRASLRMVEGAGIEPACI
jgi:hypothetical protein